MASVYKPSGRSIYRIEFKDQYDVTRTVSSGMKDRSAAKALGAKIEHDAQRIRAGLPPDHPDITGPYLSLYRVGRCWKEFREEYKRRILDGLAERTRQEAEDSLDRFERIMKPDAVAAVKTETVDDFIAARRKEPGKKKGELVSAASINKDLRHLKAALRAAAEWGYFAAAPRIRFQKEAGRLKRYVTPEHFAAIYRACEHARLPEGSSCPPAEWWRSLMVSLYMTGWRIGQALAWRREALDLTAGAAKAFASAEETKGKRDALVPLHPLVVEHLHRVVGPAELVFPWPHDRGTLDSEWHRIQSLTLVPGAGGEEVSLSLPCYGDHEHTDACHRYGFHDLRRAFATLNADRMTPEALQQLMQHRSFQTTLGYIHTARQLNAVVPNLYVPSLERPETGAESPTAE